MSLVEGGINNISISQFSETGRRVENQDNYLVIKYDESLKVCANYLDHESQKSTEMSNWSEEFVRIAVCDGVGGRNYGKEIAQRAMEMLSVTPFCNNVSALRNMLLQLHEKLYAEYSVNFSIKDSPATTIVCVDFNKRTQQFILGHVGDSRCYLLNVDGSIKQLTYDHTAVEFAYRDDELDKDEYESYLKQETSVMAQALGGGSFGIVKDAGTNYKPYRQSSDIRIDRAEDLSKNKQHHADVCFFNLDPGSQILLATDGLYASLIDASLSVEELVNKSYEAGSKDNITAVKLRILEKHSTWPS